MNESSEILGIAGVDEAGRGPLAGPVVAAAVLLDPGQILPGVRDSKKLTPRRREELADLVKQDCRAWAVGTAETGEIDRLNILQASLLAMARALGRLPRGAYRIRIDGKHAPDMGHGFCGQAETLVGGDRICPAISAASILAKVHRDRIMIALDRKYPDYGFARHKGYPTVQHRSALRKLGPSPVHRHSFAPVRNWRAIDV